MLQYQRKRKLYKRLTIAIGYYITKGVLFVKVQIGDTSGIVSLVQE